MTEIRKNEPMARHTTFRIGGPAENYAEPETVEEAAALAEECLKNGTPLRILGNGSNLLVSDRGTKGLVLSTSRLRELRLENNRLFCGAGLPLSAACLAAQKAGLTGMECLYGIPGTVGGAVRMNAGAYGGEVCQVLEEVTFWEEGKLLTLPAEALELSYRHSVFMHRKALILSAVFRLEVGDPEAILGKMQELTEKRRDKQPLEYPSAGSTFKRPEGAYAAALIDGCGLKGFRVGGAEVSTKHAGFVINAGNATAADVLSLMEAVREKVSNETGFVLEPEVEFWGSPEEWKF